MITTKPYNSGLFSILFKGGDIVHYESFRKNKKPVNRFQEFSDFVNSCEDIDCVFIKGSNFLFTPEITTPNIIFASFNEEGNYFIDDEQAREKNYYFYLNYVNTDFVLYDLNEHSDIKFLFNPFCYGKDFKNIQEAININSNANIEDLKKLKNNSKVLWAGSYFGTRIDQIKELKSIGLDIIELKAGEFNASKDRYIDFLVKYECCAVLSLDGDLIGCPRDIEIAMNQVPNLKYTRTNLDFSGGGGIYLARGISEVESKIQQIKIDLVDENYEKILRARRWMGNAYDMKKRNMNDVSLFAFASYAGLDTDDIILHPEYKSDIKIEDWAKIVGNLNNIKKDIYDKIS